MRRWRPGPSWAPSTSGFLIETCLVRFLISFADFHRRCWPRSSARVDLSSPGQNQRLSIVENRFQEGERVGGGQSLFGGGGFAFLALDRGHADLLKAGSGWLYAHGGDLVLRAARNVIGPAGGEFVDRRIQEVECQEHLPGQNTLSVRCTPTWIRPRRLLTRTSVSSRTFSRAASIRCRSSRSVSSSTRLAVRLVMVPALYARVAARLPGSAGMPHRAVRPAADTGGRSMLPGRPGSRTS